MSITFNCEADVILWAFAKLLIIFAERRYTFALHCIWWIASLVQLDTALRYLIEHHRFPSEIREPQDNKIDRQISPVPRDLQNDSRERAISNFEIKEPLCINKTINTSRNTWRPNTINTPRNTVGPNRINNRVESKKQRKKTRRLDRIQQIKKSEEAKLIKERSAAIIK